ncbi:hypothetical protein E1B28_000780 [Marasmius oreades]|uniref:RPA43 OB domain-containing protein n=1 Tax=Marasmius oreades TaxID=181124 RepID=A0A9P8AEZ2_9AGAR|nr:uncharacterized protein E1B28_000780 [Marasmius oreades]KAG7098880.1 hypothetical protein E1B28_000780 [Marasmius oreades]
MPQATHSTRKRKHSESNVHGLSKKRSRHASKVKHDKGNTRDTGFQVVKASLVVSVPPIFSIDPKSGVAEMLDSMIMRYIPAFEGVVLSHSNPRFLEKQASIRADCPFLICKISFDATVWRPRVGMKLVGKINLCSPDHVSLLVHKTFNVSIPRHHIPTDQYVFEYGPAENDPEFGVAQGGAEDVEKEAENCGGRWIDKSTDMRLGEPDGHLEFTVVGLTIANEMLSLLGSIQSDPFSPSHIHLPTAKASETSDAEKVDTQLRTLTPADEEEEDDSEEDTSKVLRRPADQMNPRQTAETEYHSAEKNTKQKKKQKVVNKSGGVGAIIKKKSSGKGKDQNL